ncbi:phosphoglycerate mutase family protein [Elsinoe ampelina]|uniref:Phosphoglycerate mutase family protein n=1 Tax=Elsinoe ampelina TaxID=302913 RepID=A0A6A6GE06_9PEZI|nr:phosphoglycerate mutase family protein [Elsinoe ampelina]
MSVFNKFEYEVAPGFFQQDDPTVDPSTCEYTRDFGLIARPDPSQQTTHSTPWSRFSETLSQMNASALDDAQFHLFFLGRHGQGWHNVAESKYGTKAWDDHFSKLDSSDGMDFVDARLTETGRQQARLAHETFAHALDAGLPPPERYLVSPLDRCLETCRITFGGLALPPNRPFRPVIHENIREVFGEHTCDKRSTKTAIQARHPDLFEFEQGFAVDDPYWKADVRETDAEVDTRICRFLDDLFASAPNARVWSFTVHSGVIASFLRVVGHREFAVQTGAVIPVLLNVTRNTKS